MKTKIISLRGNAGSGKSTISNMIMESQKDKNILYLEQDNFRMNLIHPKDDENFSATRNKFTVESLCNIISWAYGKFDIIILDGLFKVRNSKKLYDFIVEKNFDLMAFYFDLSFEETALRHSTREKSKLFDASEMKDWYLPKDFMPQIQETIIDEKMSKEEIFAMILNGLK